MPELFMHEKFPKYFFAGLTMIALGLVSIGLFTAKAIHDAKRDSDVISVTGSARQTVRSDWATWGITVWCLNPTVPPYECVKQRGERVREFLKQQALPEYCLRENPIRVEQMFQQDRMKGTSEFSGYKCVLKIEVHTALVDSLDEITRRISDLIPELIEITFDAPQYYYTKLANLRVSLLADATLDAKARAEMIAQSAGGRVSSLRNARMGVIQVTAPNSRDVRDYGTYDTSTIDKDVTAVVTASFAVE